MSDDPFLDAVGVLGPALLGALDGLEQVFRRLHPPAIDGLRAAATPLRDRLDGALEDFREVSPPDGLGDFAAQLDRSAGHAAEALRLFCESAAPTEGIARVLGAMREHCQSQEALYPLRSALPPVSSFFLEPPWRDDPKLLDPDPPTEARVGFHTAHNERDERGGFTLYVPESIPEGEARPLIVALHGGSGHGADFLWTWLREARSRRCLLLSPTSRGPTWSLNPPDRDGDAILSMIAFVRERFSVDPERVLLTGLSDGATYALLHGLAENVPYTALAPLSGVFHPANFANGNVQRARGRRIYLVHGALDWMFPAQFARMTHEELAKAGADITYREIEDLSHTYAREENARVLEWLDPSLSAPEVPPDVPS